MDEELFCSNGGQCFCRNDPALHRSTKRVVMLKAYKYRLYPSKAQQRLLEQTLETCRRWYNTCLAERKAAYEKEKRSIGKYEQLRRVKELAGRGFGLLMTTHFPDHAFLCASQVAVLKAGALLAAGRPEDVLTKQRLESAYGVSLRIVEVDAGMRVCVPEMS